MRVLITGITGPIGSALAEYLSTLPEVEIHGFKRWRSDTRPLEHLRQHLTFHEGDIEDAFSVSQAVQQAAPDRIYHLAAQSYPSESWAAPITTLRTNVEGTVNLLEAVRRHAPTARIHIAGSSAAYGWIRPEDTPILESHPTRPVSPYGVSKVAAELTGLQYQMSYGLHVVATRFFNQVGPHQGDRCSIQTFCQQMAAIEAHRQSPILQVGNLEARRDFTHTTDTARALWLLLGQAPPGVVYNLCSGRAIRIGDIVDIVRTQGRVASDVMVDPARLRPVDEPLLVGSNQKLHQVTGWQPQITMEQIVAELLTFWRQRLGASSVTHTE